MIVMTDVEIKRHLEVEKNKLVNFGKDSRNLYLYGAGNIARAVLDILEDEEIVPAALIVSSGETKETFGYKVITAREASQEINREDGVIPAFTGAVGEELYKNLFPATPQMHMINHLDILAMDDELCFQPILNQLEEMFGHANKHFCKEDIHRILVVRLDLIGDMVFTTPFFRELRRNFPDAHITLIVRTPNYSIVKGCPYMTEVLTYDCPFQQGELSRQCEKYEEIKQRVELFARDHFNEKMFDAVFFPRELLAGRNVIDELLLGFYSGANIRIARQLDLHEIYGDHLFMQVNKFFSFISRRDVPMHESQYSLQMLKDIGCTIVNQRMELYVTENDRIDATERMPYVKSDVKKIALGIVASVPQRMWPSEYYIELINMFNKNFETKYMFILFGGEDAIDVAKSIVGGVHSDSKECLIDMTGKLSLLQSVALMNCCDLYLGSNTGLLHFASACNIPSVTIYSELSDGKPTDGDAPERMGAWMVPHINLIPPAGHDGCHRVCRMHFPHCIKLITPKMAMNAAIDLLGM